jgi:hypothetical protein
MIKGFIIFFFTVVLFIGNIGVPVFTHACKEDGVFRSFFIETADHCEKENVDLPPCCESEKSQEDDCCHDETSLIQLKLDYSLTWNQFHFPDYYFFQAPQIQAILLKIQHFQLLLYPPIKEKIRHPNPGEKHYLSNNKYLEFRRLD